MSRQSLLQSIDKSIITSDETLPVGADTLIKTLMSRQGDTVLPRTKSSAVTMGDNTSLEYSIHNVPTSSVKVSAEVAALIGAVEGTDLATFLINYTNNAVNTVATAEIITE